MAAGLGTNELNEADVMRFDVLPDDVLLDIFEFHTNSLPYDKEDVQVWQALVHVCRRWRLLVFGSPRRLNLRLVCTPYTRARDKLDVWPALPIIVQDGIVRRPVISAMDNIIAALKQINRVCQISLWGLSDWRLEKLSTAMEVQFPELTEIRLYSFGATRRAIPDSFLGGSAPRLRRFYLTGIPCPGLPKLLSSATHLVLLCLSNIPLSGYISPEAMVASLSALSSLESLYLNFESPRSHPDLDLDTRRSPLVQRSVLPALAVFRFQGNTEYLEDFVNRIDTPQLDSLRLDILNRIDFGCPQLAQFISRIPKHRKRDNAHVQFSNRSAGVVFGTLGIFISCREPDPGLLSVAQVCSSSIPSMVEAVEVLYIELRNSRSFWGDDAIENTSWLQLLLPFTAVKNLYLTKEFAPGIAATLHEIVGDGITGVLPSLHDIFVEELEPFEQNIGQFVVARQLSGYPVAISGWSKDPDSDM